MSAPSPPEFPRPIHPEGGLPQDLEESEKIFLHRITHGPHPLEANVAYPYWYLRQCESTESDASHDPSLDPASIPQGTYANRARFPAAITTPSDIFAALAPSINHYDEVHAARAQLFLARGRLPHCIALCDAVLLAQERANRRIGPQFAGLLYDTMWRALAAQGRPLVAAPYALQLLERDPTDPDVLAALTHIFSLAPHAHISDAAAVVSAAGAGTDDAAAAAAAADAGARASRDPLAALAAAGAQLDANARAPQVWERTLGAIVAALLTVLGSEARAQPQAQPQVHTATVAASAPASGGETALARAARLTRAAYASGRISDAAVAAVAQIGAAMRPDMISEAKSDADRAAEADAALGSRLIALTYAGPAEIARSAGQSAPRFAYADLCCGDALADADPDGDVNDAGTAADAGAAGSAPRLRTAYERLLAMPSGRLDFVYDASVDAAAAAAEAEADAARPAELVAVRAAAAVAAEDADAALFERHRAALANTLYAAYCACDDSPAPAAAAAAMATAAPATLSPAVASLVADLLEAAFLCANRACGFAVATLPTLTVSARANAATLATLLRLAQEPDTAMAAAAGTAADAAAAALSVPLPGLAHDPWLHGDCVWGTDVPFSRSLYAAGAADTAAACLPAAALSRSGFGAVMAAVARARPLALATLRHHRRMTDPAVAAARAAALATRPDGTRPPASDAAALVAVEMTRSPTPLVLLWRRVAAALWLARGDVAPGALLLQYPRAVAATTADPGAAGAAAPGARAVSPHDLRPQSARTESWAAGQRGGYARALTSACAAAPADSPYRALPLPRSLRSSVDTLVACGAPPPVPKRSTKGGAAAPTQARAPAPLQLLRLAAAPVLVRLSPADCGDAAACPDANTGTGADVAAVVCAPSPVLLTAFSRQWALLCVSTHPVPRRFPPLTAAAGAAAAGAAAAAADNASAAFGASADAAATEPEPEAEEVFVNVARTVEDALAAQQAGEEVGPDGLPVKNRAKPMDPRKL